MNIKTNKKENSMQSNATKCQRENQNKGEIQITNSLDYLLY